MKKSFCLLMILFILNVGVLYGKEDCMIDIENHWAKESIVRMMTNEKINGYPDRTFRPNHPITILEFIKMMMENLDYKIVEEGLKKWPDYYIATAKKYELEYDYNQYLTRYQAIEIMTKLLDIHSVSASSKKLKDVDTKYQSSISKLYKLKIINGYEDGSFRGENSVTRAEAVVMTLRAMEANQKIIQNKKYDINCDYTNLYQEDETSGDINQITYNINENKLYFYDKRKIFKHEWVYN